MKTKLLFLFFSLRVYNFATSQWVDGTGLEENCGQTENDTEVVENYKPVFRIVNGWPQSLGDVPYQIAFRRQFKSVSRKNFYTFCGGSLIRNDRILSAAHCFEPYAKGKGLCCRSGRISEKQLTGIYAVAGSLKRVDVYRYRDSIENGQWRSLKSVKYPKDYEFPYEDICVVATTWKFYFNHNIRSIDYTRTWMDYSGHCMISGYGRKDMRLNRNSMELRGAYVQLIPNKACTELHRRNMAKFVCISNSVADVAPGDSGGPLSCLFESRKTDAANGLGKLVGVTCGAKVYETFHLSYFTRVSSYSKFIATNIAVGFKSVIYTVSLVTLLNKLCC